MKLKQRRNSLGASDWFDINFLGSFLNSDLQVKTFLNEQKHTIGDEAISSRLLNHWYEAGIVADDRPNGKGWKKFSFSEIIWLNIVVKLRKFGMDLNRIKEVKNYLDSYNSAENVSKCPLLDFYIVYAKTSNKPVKLVVFESGEAEIARQVEIDIANHLGIITEDFISIDINKLLDKVLESKGPNTDYLNYATSDLAQEIEKSVYLNDVKSVTIRVNDEEYIIGEEYFTNDKAKANLLMSMVQYGSKTERKHDGKSTFQVTNTKKIKRKNP